MVAAIQAGFPQREIERRAFEHQRAVEEKRRVIVGENAFVAEDPAEDGALALHKPDPSDERRQLARLQRVRDERDRQRIRQSLDSLADRARGHAEPAAGHRGPRSRATRPWARSRTLSAASVRRAPATLTDFASA
jgi:methylmalonyl-CoA mutase N-terminal domain/subunit